MGEVAATMKIMPAGVETDLDDLKNKLEAALPEGSSIYASETEPIAFGLKALKVVVLVGDLEGGTEPVEEAFAAVEGVESVQVTELGRPV
ncbi:translation elongation factor 1B (aEF-1B) [Methanococcoides vulcani]|uniref:Elongation factor 1-beta n=1 Tax=Methanococcoides vulcani TaxID=1353158 RepID=A0A1H9Y982_9EURY|nr:MULTISPECIES: elongation factor 1-beta [Methanococcoides]SES65387.1 translation elongation factor 1B (aEF-1B) [Methanococcoides vulcani]